MSGTKASRTISAPASNNRLHPENAAAFDRLDAADREAFLALSSDLQLTLQTEREILEWLPEIAYSRRQTVAAVLGSEEILAVWKSPKLNAPQKIQKIRAHLFSSRFPRYDAAQKQWKRLSQKTFGNMRCLAVTPNPYFEKDKLELRISVSSAREALDVMGKLAAIPQSTWASLIDPTKKPATP
jgi:hypothetical protein